MGRQAQRAVPRHLVGAHGPGNGRNRIVRVRSRGWLDPRRAARTGAWWDAVPRRGRRHAADDAGQVLARADRSELLARWRPHDDPRRRSHHFGIGAPPDNLTRRDTLSPGTVLP